CVDEKLQLPEIRRSDDTLQRNINFFKYSNLVRVNQFENSTNLNYMKYELIILMELGICEMWLKRFKLQYLRLITIGETIQ
ncbi:MAG TPA: hypothetical protein VD694_01655, partial [Nitrososphaeraceae archaeon]|nr:hypothetical protein [Nitrososphaeraceae archaeon]